VTAAVLFAAAQFTAAPPVLALDGIQPGMEAPELTLENLSGESQALSDLDGKRLTVLVFWSTWSSNSGKLLARMEGLHRKYVDQGLSVVAVNVENQEINEADLAGIKGMVEQQGLTFPVLLDRGLKAFHDFGVIAVPTTVVLDCSRIVKEKLPGMPLMAFEELFDSLVAAMEHEPETTAEITNAALATGCASIM